jgi:hypothetical protein
MAELRAWIGGQWVTVGAPAPVVPDEVFVGPDDPYLTDPAGTWEMWIKPDVFEITSISPTSAQNPIVVTFIVKGTLFEPTDVVQWGGGAMATVFVSDRELHGTKDAITSSPRVYDIDVKKVDGTRSNKLQFTLIDKPAATLTSVTPAGSQAAGVANLTIIGTNFFDPYTQPFLNGAQIPDDTNRVVVSPTMMTLTIPTSSRNIGMYEFGVGNTGSTPQATLPWEITA